ncbi:hypothetical protein LguiA_034652 [Lonicera macranthoides]
MALILPSSSSAVPARKPQFPLPKIHHLHALTTKPYHHLSVKSKGSSTEPPVSGQSTDDTSSSPPPPPKKPNSAGLGFGTPPKKKQQRQQPKGKRDRASIIRREPVEKLGFGSPKEDGGRSKEDQSENERAFLLAWLGLGSVIIIEGLLLAASGFLPEEWDKLAVKYVYPSFTPTVFLFVAGTVVYGVLKYLQNANLQNPK